MTVQITSWSNAPPVARMTVGDPGDPPASSSPQSPSLEANHAQPAPAPNPGLAAHSDQELLDNFPVAKLTKLDELISNPR